VWVCYIIIYSYSVQEFEKDQAISYLLVAK